MIESAPSPEDARACALVARIQAGDAGFDELYRLYFDRVFAYTRVVLRDEHAAQDVAQHTFLRALEALPGYRQGAQPFRAWLFVIARHAVIDYRARLNRADVCDPHVVEVLRERAESDVAPEEFGGELSRVIARLPLAQRQVLFLRFVADLGPGEIADVLGRSTDSVRQIQHRALAALRQRVGVRGRVSVARSADVVGMAA